MIVNSNFTTKINNFLHTENYYGYNTGLYDENKICGVFSSKSSNKVNIFNDVNVIDYDKFYSYIRDVFTVPRNTSIKKIYMTNYSSIGYRTLSSIMKDKGYKIVRDINKADAIVASKTLLDKTIKQHIKDFTTKVVEYGGWYFPGYLIWNINNTGIHPFTGPYHSITTTNTGYGIFHVSYGKKNLDQINDMINILSKIEEGKFIDTDEIELFDNELTLDSIKTIRSAIVSDDPANVKIGVKMFCCTNFSKNPEYVKLLWSSLSYNQKNRAVYALKSDIDGKRTLETLSEYIYTSISTIAIAIRLLDNNPNDEIAQYFINQTLKDDYNISLDKKIMLV